MNTLLQSVQKFKTFFEHFAARLSAGGPLVVPFAKRDRGRACPKHSGQNALGRRTPCGPFCQKGPRKGTNQNTPAKMLSPPTGANTGAGAGGGTAGSFGASWPPTAGNAAAAGAKAGEVS